MGKVIIYRKTYNPDRIVDGDVKGKTRREVIKCDDVSEAIDALRGADLTELSVYPIPETFGGHEWLSHPDGSYIDDHYKGTRCEPTGHLEGWSDDEFATIIRAVTAK